MSDGFVQEHAGPARAKHDFHRAGGRILSFKLNNGLARGLVGVMLDQLVVEEIHPDAPTTARNSRLQIAVVIGDAHHAHSRQRLNVADQLAFGCCDQDDFEFVSEAGLHFADSPVESARRSVNAIEQLDLARQRLFVNQAPDGVKIVRRMIR
ncbi:MAG: hypothetical protein JMDDDDMK_01534 [Acidobacteria bacterium]|nr:hypothetical protein [Acidobacteriota bacterium]